MLGDPRSRDIVLIDQRGTGGSGVLTCPLYSGTGIARFTGAFMPLDAVRECRDRLSRIADLRHYTSSIAVDDAEATALGYDRVNLFGGSYGTRMAQVFLRRHPKRMVGHPQGVTSMRDRIPIGFARSAQRAFDRLLAECEATPTVVRCFRGFDPTPRPCSIERVAARSTSSSPIRRRPPTLRWRCRAPWSVKSCDG